MKESDRISEDSSKKSERGRPRTDAVMDEMVKEVLAEGKMKTRRGAVEYILGCSTFSMIVDAWKADPTGTPWAEFYLGKDGKGLQHESIMAALGRIEDEAVRMQTARIIAERKMSTRAAVAAIRRMRLNREDKPNLHTLFDSLVSTVNAYLAAHPAATGGLVVLALRELADAIEADGLNGE